MLRLCVLGALVLVAAAQNATEAPTSAPTTQGGLYIPEVDSTKLSQMNIVMSVFSFIGSLFIITSYVAIPALRNFVFKLVLYMAISDLLLSFGNFLGDAGGNTTILEGTTIHLCRFQAVVISFSELASIMWSMAIAFTLMQSVLREKQEFKVGNVDGHLLKYHIICWGLPTIMTILPFTSNSYGNTGGWCWIVSGSRTSQAWRYITFYIPLWFAIIYNAAIYAMMYQKIKILNSASVKMDDTQESMLRLRLYPLVLLICYFWATINRLYESISGESSMWLSALHILFASSAGFVNAVVYGLTPDVRRRVHARLFSKDISVDMPLPSHPVDDVSGIAPVCTKCGSDLHAEPQCPLGHVLIDAVPAPAETGETR